MKKLLYILLIMTFLQPASGRCEGITVWQIRTQAGEVLTEICEEPNIGDEYISGDNQHYRINSVEESTATVVLMGSVELPSLEWMNAESAVPVSSMRKLIAIYCTHSDESYKPSDGYYTTTETGTIYQVAHALGDELQANGIEVHVADTLHHPHDAGAYRRSRQTAVELMRAGLPDCMIDIHRDGIPDPASYAVTIGGEDVSKIRLLVGRGNQNAELNKEFALLIKAVADRVYPGLIKDIYLGKGTFNQDLLPRSILFECGTYTLEKERVLASMPLIADVLDRALYGGIVGSAGRVTSDAGTAPHETAGITMGEPDVVSGERQRGFISGGLFLLILLVVGVGGFAVLSTGTLKGGLRKTARSISEMTGGVIGKKPDNAEDHEHS